MLYQLIVLLPLFGAIGAGLFGRWLGHRGAEILTTSLMLLAAFLSIIAFVRVGIYNDVPADPQVFFTWFDVGGLEANWGVRVDTLTVVMLVVVNGVSSLVHLYSIGYMSHDPNRARFFCYLSLFTFAMLMLVTSDNFLQLFFGWEGVGLASYLLIGFWYKKPSANAAAIKAFIVNRVGDFGFALGIMAIFFVFKSVEFDEVFRRAPEYTDHYINFLGQPIHALTLISTLLFIGAMGKSAQFMLHTWLPDAMEGPTPVSALIHAATMVTAGVFLVCRCSFLFEHAPETMVFVTIIGAVTAFFAATVGLVQNDIKRVIAYSTCSQLGYMFVAAGIGAYEAAMFHLFTHAFFKALLFLCAGSVIHAMHDEQDMRNMGGLIEKLPWTGGLMIIGTLAITGVGWPHSQVGFAGFVSKDAIIESAYAATGSHAVFGFWVLVIAAAMTSYYSWRLIFMTFYGKTRAPQETYAKAHESPPVMMVPLVALAIGAVLAGSIFYNSFLGKGRAEFWALNHGSEFAQHAVVGDHAETAPADHASPAESGHEAEAVETIDEHAEDIHAIENSTASEHADDDAHHGDAHHATGPLGTPLGEGKLGAIFIKKGQSALDDAHSIKEGWVFYAPFIAMLIGLGWSYLWFIRHPEIPEKIAQNNGLLYRFFLNKWYFDELYDFLFVNPAKRLGKFFWKKGDGWLIDGFGPNGIASSVLATTKRVVKIQTGYVYHYAFAMLIGIALLISFYYGRSLGAF